MKFRPHDEDVAGGDFALGSILSSVTAKNVHYPNPLKIEQVPFRQKRRKATLENRLKIQLVERCQKCPLAQPGQFCPGWSELIFENVGIHQIRGKLRSPNLASEKMLMNCPQIWGLLKIKHSPNWGAKKPHAHEWAQGIDKIKICGYTENRKGAAGKRVAP